MVEHTYQNKLTPFTTTPSVQQSSSSPATSIQSTISSANHPPPNGRRQSNVAPANVYVNVSGTGGGSVQVCTGDRFGGQSLQQRQQQQQEVLQQQQHTMGLNVNTSGLSSPGEVHVHH